MREWVIVYDTRDPVDRDKDPFNPEFIMRGSATAATAQGAIGKFMEMHAELDGGAIISVLLKRAMDQYVDEKGT